MFPNDSLKLSHEVQIWKADLLLIGMEYCKRLTYSFILEMNILFNDVPQQISFNF